MMGTFNIKSSTPSGNPKCVVSINDKGKMSVTIGRHTESRVIARYIPAKGWCRAHRSESTTMEDCITGLVGLWVYATKEDEKAAEAIKRTLEKKK